MNPISPDHYQMGEPLIQKAATSKSHFQLVIIFSALGAMYAFPYNNLLNIIHILSVEIYNDDTIADILLIINEVFSLIMVSYLMLTSGVKPRLLQLSVLIQAIVALATPLIVMYIPGDSIIIKPTLSFLGVVFGVLLGSTSTIIFTLAGMMPQPLTGYVAFGEGISGLLAFSLFFLGDKILWIREDGNSTRQLINTTWLLFSSSSLKCFICFFLLFLLYKNPIFKQQMDYFYYKGESSSYDEEHQETQQILSPTIECKLDNLIDKSNNTLDEIPIEMQAQRSLKEILKDSSIQLLIASITSWVAMHLTPIIGPYLWKGSYINDLQIGIFQFGDFLGRYLSSSLNFMKIKENKLIYYALGRLIYIPLFILPVFFDAFSGNFFTIFLTFSFAFSNGQTFTLASLYAPGTVDRVKEKSIVGVYLVLCTQSSYTIGMFTSKLYKIFLESFMD